MPPSVTCMSPLSLPPSRFPLVTPRRHAMLLDAPLSLSTHTHTHKHTRTVGSMMRYISQSSAPDSMRGSGFSSSSASAVSVTVSVCSSDKNMCTIEEPATTPTPHTPDVVSSACTHAPEWPQVKGWGGGGREGRTTRSQQACDALDACCFRFFAAPVHVVEQAQQPVAHAGANLHQEGGREGRGWCGGRW